MTRPRIGLACNLATQARCLNEAVRARVEALGEFAIASFDEPLSRDAPPPPNPQVEKNCIVFAREFDLVMLSHGVISNGPMGHDDYLQLFIKAWDNVNLLPIRSPRVDAILDNVGLSLQKVIHGTDPATEMKSLTATLQSLDQ